MAASDSTPLLPVEYEGLIERVRETADTMIPRNATVLVITRGDEELLRIGPRRAMHFPQDEFGRYVGYHPEDSDAAVELLEDMRARGGEYLLLPRTAFWWLDYYEGFRDHLERNYPAIVSADDCMVFELATTGVQTATPDADMKRMSTAMSSRQLAGPLDELLRALLPDDARVAVVASGEAELPSFGDCHAVRAPEGGKGLPALLEEARAGEAEFLVIPAASYDQVHRGEEPPESVAEWRLVTRQKNLAEIYERGSDTEAEASPADRRPPTADSPSDGERRTANGGWWQRFLRWFQRP